MTELKSISVIVFSGKDHRLGRVVQKCMAWGKRKGHNKLLVQKEKALTVNEYDSAVSGFSDEKRKIMKSGDLNKEVYEDLRMSIKHTTQ